jgi:hypothetical protein
VHLALASSACSKKNDASATTPGPASQSQASTTAAANQPAMGAVTGATPCERGYNGMQQMVAAFGQKRMPPKAAYLAECAKLPGEVQECLEPSYGAPHRAECEAAGKKMDPAASKHWQEVSSPISLKDSTVAQACVSPTDFDACRECCRDAHSGGYNFDASRRRGAATEVRSRPDPTRAYLAPPRSCARSRRSRPRAAARSPA